MSVDWKRGNLRLVAAVAAAVLSAAGCGDGDGPMQPPPGSDEGVSFRYSGDRSGSFSAEGDPIVVDGELAPGTWAAAVSTDTGFVLVGARSAGLPLVDLIFLTVPDPTVGGSTDFGGVAGGAGVVAFDFDASVALDPDTIVDSIDPTDVYVLTEGTLTLQTLTATRATGSVTGSGLRFDGGPRLFVENGSFDVPVVDLSLARIPSAGLALAPGLLDGPVR